MVDRKSDITTDGGGGARRSRVAVLYIVLVLCWGSTFMWVKIATPETSPLVLADGRLLFGFATVLASVAAAGAATRARHDRRALQPWVRRGVVMSLLSTAIPFVLLALAERHITSGTAAVLNSAAPLFSAIVVMLGLGSATDRLLPGSWVGLVLGVVGVGVLVGQTPSGSLVGCALMLGVVVTYASGGVYASRHFRHAPPYAAALLTTGISAILLVPVAVLGWLADPPTLGAFAAIAALGATGTGVAYVVYYELIRTIGVTRTLTVAYLQPVVAITLGLLVLGEPLEVWQLAGLFFILCGVAIVTGRVRLVRRAVSRSVFPP
jgi:drug/metabolite transporter (DMT)-like permease